MACGNILLDFILKIGIYTASRLIEEGRTRRHERRVRDAMDVKATADGWRPARTEKSCAPGASVLASCATRSRVVANRGKKADPWGEHEGPC
jgi:hypothetical protein